MIPKALRDRPRLRASDGYYLETFYELSRGRSVGEVPQPISITAFKDYCELMGIRSVAERQALYQIVSRLDGIFLLKMTEKANQST